MRGLDAATITALSGGSMRWATLIKMDFASPVYLTSWPHDISALGQVFSSSAHILSIGDAKEDANLKVGSTSLILSGAEQSFISLFLSNNYINVGYSQHVAILDDQGVVIGTPVEVYDGLISGVTIEDSGKTSKVKIDISSHWADFEKKSGRKTNHNSQQVYFPGDNGFEFAATKSTDIKWGKK